MCPDTALRMAPCAACHREPKIYARRRRRNSRVKPRRTRHRTAATEPARRVGPCMQQASSSTTPSSFGKPPRPTVSSLGSSSCPLQMCRAASSVSPPSSSIRYAWPTVGRLVWRVMMTGFLALPKCGVATFALESAVAAWLRASPAVAAIAERERNSRRVLGMIVSGKKKCAEKHTRQDRSYAGKLEEPSVATRNSRKVCESCVFSMA